MASQKIRIKLMSYDVEMLDQAASKIVETMQKAGAKISGPIPLPTEKEITINCYMHLHLLQFFNWLFTFFN